MVELWQSILRAFAAVLTFLHDVLIPVFGENSWGWAIILLTLFVRILLLPLAIKQTRSMRAMQAIQPQMKALQKKYKVDRELLKKDPEQYKAKKAKLNEEMMALYREEGANPAASCLPLLAQAPVFLVLFWTLRDFQELNGAPFHFVTRFVAADSDFTGLAAVVSQAGWPGWLLIVLMSGSMFVSQKQMMARNAVTQGDANPMAQQQKILLYVMPVFLAVISFQFPLGILLYWVTTNAWQVAQQWIILREVRSEPAGKDASGGASPAASGSDGEAPRRSPGASSGTKPKGSGAKGSSKDDRSSSGKSTSPESSPGDGDGPDGVPPKATRSKGSSKDPKKRTSDDDRGSAADGPSDPRSSPTDGSTAEASSDDPTAAGPAEDASKPGGPPRQRGKPSKPSKADEASPNGSHGAGASPRRSPKRDHLPRRPRR